VTDLPVFGLKQRLSLPKSRNRLPDLLSLETVHGKLTVWSKDVTQSRQQLAKTFSSRGLDYPVQDIQLPFEQLKACTPFACVFETGLQLKEPILFENKSYEFSFKFSDKVEAAETTHYLASVNDSFRLVDSTLRGTINFGNNYLKNPPYFLSSSVAVIITPNFV
jgi:hypothetical protein